MPTSPELANIDAAFERLNTILDTTGALDAAATQHAAYALRLAIVQALGDQDRIEPAEASLAELKLSSCIV